MAKHPMLDLVPLAGARWKVAHLDLNVEFVREFLQFVFPQATAMSIAAAAVGRNQDSSKPDLRITSPSQATPPHSYRSYRKLCRVMRDAHVHPSFIFPDDFLLFRVDGEGRLPRSLLRLDAAMDMLKLGIPIRMLFSLNGFTVRLQAVTCILKQPGHGSMTYRVSPLL